MRKQRASINDREFVPAEEGCLKREEKTGTGFDDLVKAVSGIAAQLQNLSNLAAEQYAPVVESIIRSNSRDVRHIEHTLDGLLDFCGFDPALQLYRRLCQHYWDIDPAATAQYVQTYRELWDSEAKGSKDSQP
ncbi:MAG: hypothetical protein HGA78_07925 [Nitrospirales bacterium]|nr:hypothetical protein [Nitrospirales bacterium]